MFKFKTIDISKVPFKNLLIVLLSIVCITSVRECSNKSLEVERTEGQWKFKYASMVKDYTTEINEKGEKIAHQEVLLVNEKQAKSLLEEENSNLKKAKSVTKVKTRTVVKEVFIPFEEVVSAVERPLTEGDTSLYYTPKKIFRFNNEWYGISGKVLEGGLQLDSVYFNNTQTHIIGWKKDKWYKKKYAVVEIKNSNPYSNTVGVQNIVVTPKQKKFHQTTAFKIGVGLVGGIWLKTQLSK